MLRYHIYRRSFSWCHLLFWAFGKVQTNFECLLESLFKVKSLVLYATLVGYSDLWTRSRSEVLYLSYKYSSSAVS